MAFLTISGVSYNVARAGASARAHTYAGASERAASGKLRSSKHAKKRNWQFTLGPMAEAAFQTLDAATDNGAQVPCGGDALGVAATCEVIINESAHVADGLGFQRIVNIELNEA